MQTLIGQRILARLEQVGISQAELARRCGLAQSTINALVNGTSKSSAHLHEIAKELSTSTAWLVGDTASPEQGSTALSAVEALAEVGAVLVPLVDVAYSMGGGSMVSDFPAVERVPVSRAWLQHFTASAPEQIFVAKGEGDSMTPTVNDGDFVIVDRSEGEVRSQDRLYALAYGDAGMIKRVRSLPGGRFALMSDNPQVPPFEAHASELTFVGRVVGVVRRV